MGRHDEEHRLLPIGTVVDLLREDYPDVSHSSLRFLEREGLVTPARTPGGHRLYTPADLSRVRQIKSWQAQRLSLEEIRRRLKALGSVGSPAGLAELFLECGLRGDLSGARRVILGANDVGLPLDVVFAEILRPALWELGDRWERGTVSVAQEKEVSEVARELISELTLRHTGTGSDSQVSVVAACVAGEPHELGLRMISGLLRARGVSVHFLGAAVATEFLVHAVQQRQPYAVLLSVTRDDYLPAMREIVEAFRQASVAPRIVAGGQAVDRHSDLVSELGIEPAQDEVDQLARSLITGRAA